LRPFEPDEDHLFFGREKEIDDLMRRLRFNRFLGVTGTSGCGKSSLVRSGLLPSLESGMMVQAGSSWRMAVMRPGEDPLGHLAAALDAPDVLGDEDAEFASTHRVMLEATLRRGTRGLVQAVRQAHLPPHDNVLILVDQFEELFRFRRLRDSGTSGNEAVAFVKLLLEAVNQTDLPIYVVLTMRSDFIGDCMDYPGLPEALNESQYLVPRMTRDELRSAITGPIAVAGGQIAPRLVLRLLNDTGDERDDLPLLQHALMRTWEHWTERRSDGRPMDIADYEAIGTMETALSRHAEEAFQEAGPASQRTTELVFRALTDTFSDPRGVRRPTSIAELAAISGAPESDVVRLVEIFRRPGRSFLMPPVPVPLSSRTIVDVSHESLLRCWDRLQEWAQAERQSAAIYVRLAREATWHEEGEAGLWGDPELELGLRWRREHGPTAAWARRYDSAFDRAIAFLDRSEQERARQRAERRAARIRRLVVAWGTAAVLLVLLVIANRQRLAATAERNRAEQNLQIAADAVDQLLVSIDRDPATIGADVPAMQQLRRELLERARPFYDEFLQQSPSDAILSGLAVAHLRLGHINRMLNDTAAAIGEYERAITAFGNLADRNPADPDHRRSLAAAHNWLGETLRLGPETHARAEAAYGRALELQAELLRQDPSSPVHARELARTHYNRGILHGQAAVPGEEAFDRADADFREAIRLLESLPSLEGDPQASQDLGRAVNNLGTLLANDDSRGAEARTFYDRAVELHEGLVARRPDNREYKLELAQFSNNLSDLMRRSGDVQQAEARNQRARALIEELARPAPSLGIERADGHNLRGHILQARSATEALAEYRASLRVFEDLAQSVDVVHLPNYHARFGDLLFNLGSLSQERPSLAAASGLLAEATRAYVALGERALAAGLTAPAERMMASLAALEPELAERDRRAVAALSEDLRRKVR
jgi:tetratricopeptide (TPR) repeat protein